MCDEEEDASPLSGGLRSGVKGAVASDGAFGGVEDIAFAFAFAGVPSGAFGGVGLVKSILGTEVFGALATAFIRGGGSLKADLAGSGRDPLGIFFGGASCTVVA